MPHGIKQTTKEFKENPKRFSGGRKQAIAIGLAKDRKSHRGAKMAPKPRKGR